MIQSVFSCAGTEASFVQNNRFRTTLVSVNFYVPLEKETVSAYALLASLLTTCGASHPDFSALNFKLTRLYGADLSSALYKVGDCLCIKFSVSTINDRFALQGETPLREAVTLLLDLLFRPKVEQGAFCGEDMKREKRMLLEHIRGEFNDKRTYARMRLIQEMYAGLPYGLYRYGQEETVEALTGEEVYRAYVKLMAEASVKVFVVGESVPDGLIEALQTYFGSRPYRETPLAETQPTLPATAVRTVTDRMDVSQGKLVMGFSMDALPDPRAIPTMVMCDIFGGGPYSKLFNHVREEMSLCYYCSSSCVRQKGFLMVDSGVEPAQADQAFEEIMKQLRDLQNGMVSDFEFDASLRSLCDSVLSNHDSLSRMDDWYTLKGLDAVVYSPQEVADFIRCVTKEEVIRAAQTVRLHTVYRLLPKEAKA